MRAKGPPAIAGGSDKRPGTTPGRFSFVRQSTTLEHYAGSVANQGLTAGI
jgi:hypothetical protein